MSLATENPSYVLVFIFICWREVMAVVIAALSAESPTTWSALLENWTTPRLTSSVEMLKPETSLFVKANALCQSDGTMDAEPSRTMTTSSLALHGGGGAGGVGGAGAGGECPPWGQVSNESTVAFVMAESKSDTCVRSDGMSHPQDRTRHPNIAW